MNALICVSHARLPSRCRQLRRQVLHAKRHRTPRTLPQSPPVPISIASLIAARHRRPPTPSAAATTATTRPTETIRPLLPTATNTIGSVHCPTSIRATAGAAVQRARPGTTSCPATPGGICCHVLEYVRDAGDMEDPFAANLRAAHSLSIAFNGIVCFSALHAENGGKGPLRIGMIMKATDGEIE